MGRLRKFRRLGKADKRLLLESAFSIAVVRAALWLLPTGALAALLKRGWRYDAGTPLIDKETVGRIAWAVEVASRHVPTTRSCLLQALTAQLLLGRRGYPVALRIGVCRLQKEKLKAHAWVEGGGKVLMGDLRDLSLYTPMVPPKGKAFEFGCE